MIKKIAVVAGVRTPFIKAWTSFNSLSAQRLGAICLGELLRRIPIRSNDIDEVIVGCVGQPIDAANVARVISLYAGIPVSKRAYTVNRNCASGFEAITSAAEKISCGTDEVVVAGGAESMSNAPLVFKKSTAEIFMQLQKAKTLGQKLAVMSQFRPSSFAPLAALQMALTDPACGLNMGQTAEVLAKKFAVSRKEQDVFALESHQKVIASRERLTEEIMPVITPPKYDDAVTEDNGARKEQNMEALAKLKPVFDRRGGTVTAGNSSQITDGACMLLLMSAEKAKAEGYPVLGYVSDYAYSGLEPSEMGLGPAIVMEKVLSRNHLGLSDIGLFEINEAFAAQVIACLKAMDSERFAKEHYASGKPLGALPRQLLNVNGGGIALGHPVGVTGARLVLTTLLEMKRRNVRKGLVSLCIGGGQGGAILLERD